MSTMGKRKTVHRDGLDQAHAQGYKQGRVEQVGSIVQALELRVEELERIVNEMENKRDGW